MAASLNFGGTSDFIDIGSMDSLDGATAFTMMAWARNTASSGGNDTILGRQKDGTSVDNILFGMYRSTPQFWLGVQVDSGIGALIKTSGLTTTDNVWYHWAWTWDSSISAQLLAGSNLYLDGVATTLINHSSGSDAFNSVQASTATARIGQRRGLTGTWNGQISYVTIHNKALTLSEVKDSMYQPSSIADNLLGYWPLLDTATIDISGAGNDGTITGDVVDDKLGPPIFKPGV